MTGSPVARAFQALRPPYGFRVILADPPWAYENWSERGEGKGAARHYETQDLDWIKGLPVKMLAADDCVLFLWCTWPLMPVWASVIGAWGFEFAGLAWEWIKYNPETGKYAFGVGYGTRKNLEPCLLATRGNPSLRADQTFFGTTTEARSHSVRDFIEAWPLDSIRAPRREHSRKPEEQYTRIEQMFDGPFVELFSRANRKGWTAWGEQVGLFTDGR